jgi:short-subunit dehydrogenase
MATVLILGATSDIASAIAGKFASKGYDLQLAARRTEELENTRKDIQIRYNNQCDLYPFDAVNLDTHRAFYNSLSPKPDIAIAVFGYMADNVKTVVDPDILLNTMQVNYTGAVSVLNIISRDYLQKRSGTIVGISSVAGERGRAKNYIDGSAKAGLTAYLSGLRNELYDFNVHVCTVLPGFVYTKMTEEMPLPAALTAHPEEVADAVYNAVVKKKNVIYVKWFWKWIMMIIRNIPEGMFKKMKI